MSEHNENSPWPPLTPTTPLPPPPAFSPPPQPPVPPPFEASGNFGEPPADESTPKKKSRKTLIAILLLSTILVGVVVDLAFTAIRLSEAHNKIIEQQQEIDEQNDIIEKKETFGAAMEDLLDEAATMKGNLLADLVPMDEYQTLATRAWHNRRSISQVEQSTSQARKATRKLQELQSEAASAANSNVTGTKYESVIDSLGAGYVASLVDNADELCESDVLACVVSDNPHTVHFDAADNNVAYMTDWLRTGIAYHEFAHVLQFTNPTPTDKALESFDGDVETMADCFALTYLDGWTLDHTVWVNNYRYWKVNIGYGYTCSADQRQVVRDWYESLGFDPQPISQ